MSLNSSFHCRDDTIIETDFSCPFQLKFRSPNNETEVAIYLQDENEMIRLRDTLTSQCLKYEVDRKLAEGE